MKYQNGKEVLPLKLLKEIQYYVEGDILYIPPKDSRRKSLGSNSNTKLLLKERNENITYDYKNGLSVSDLSKKYFLSISSIRKIVYGKSIEK